MNWLTDWKRNQRQHEKTYNQFRDDASTRGFCFACGRTASFKHKPSDWHAPWLLHRAHIVSKPRLKDRRVVNLLCPLCHLNFDGSGSIKLSHMIWMKLQFDPKHFDLKLLQHCSVRILPPAESPPPLILNEFQSRKGLTLIPIEF